MSEGLASFVWHMLSANVGMVVVILGLLVLRSWFRFQKRARKG